MTHDELRSCAISKLGFSTRSGVLAAEIRTLRAEGARLTAAEKQLELDRGKLDRTSSKQIDAFNKRVAASREAIRSFNGRIEKYNKAVGENNQHVNTFNVNCAGRPYREVDLDILSAEQRQAMTDNSTPFDLPVYSDEPVPGKSGASGQVR